ncbi:MAG TPA: hypothetical protein VFC63_16765 [Blastocatellia bacterium]|nr:hypothetical protein [Blastocatellia bacterium]
MQKKVFWGSFFIMSAIADFNLPLIWGLLATIPIGFASWWITYRTGWFD